MRATLCVDICFVGNKISCGCNESIQASIVEPGPFQGCDPGDITLPQFSPSLKRRFFF